MAASPPAGLKVRQRPPVSARSPQPELPPHLQKYVATGEALVAQPFKGITADGSVIPKLFPIEKTGVSTRPLTDPARALLDALNPEQPAQPVFALDTDARRRRRNIQPCP